MYPKDWTRDRHPKWATLADCIEYVCLHYWRVNKDAFYKWPGTVRYRGRTRLFLVEEVLAHFDAKEANLTNELPEEYGDCVAEARKHVA